MTKVLNANEDARRSNEPSEHAEYRQSFDERTAHESVVGLYDNQAKKKCRSDVISHAIRCLTTE